MFVWFIFGCCLCFHGIVGADRSETTNEVAEMDKTEVSNPILRTQPQQAFLGWDKRYPYVIDDGNSDAATEIDEQDLEKRAGGLRNPYSWMNRDNKRNKRSRNPYAWLSLEENRSLQGDSASPLSYGWFKTMDKKSRNPYSWMAAPKRARNPYSWMNFI
jgi:hypothetical protein|uniref:Uncharacterized protein n=1 Tax=Panagrolaimus sp. PS1159 TaxID=55785 RepID=A0AC35FGT5_9BILA